MKHAWSYLRFSSKPQERGDSLRRQTDLARRYADKHGLFLDVRSYADLGVSAFRGANVREGALGAFLKAVDDGFIPKGSMLLVESLDRVTRAEVMDALEIFTSIINRGITLVTLNDEQVYSRETIKDNWTKLIISIAVLARANEESATKSRRVKEAWREKRAKGEILTGNCPPWLWLNTARNGWVVIEEQAAKVQRIFKLAHDEGLGAPRIAKRLNDDSVLPFNADFWTNGTVHHVLKNKAVIGTYTPSRTSDPPIERYYPAIIEERLFSSVQDAIRSRQWKGGSNEEYVRNLFTGLCYCGYCGARMKFVSSSKPNYYMHCTAAYSNAGCGAQRILYREAQFDGIEREVLVWMLIDREQAFPQMEVTNEGGEKAVLQGAIALKKEQLDRATEAQLAGSRRAAQEMVRLENEIDELNEKLKRYVSPVGDDAYRALNDTIQMVIDLARQTKRDLGEINRLRSIARSAMQRLIERLEFYDDIKVEEGMEHRKVLIQLKGSDQRFELWAPLPQWGFGRKRA